MTGHLVDPIALQKIVIQAKKAEQVPKLEKALAAETKLLTAAEDRGDKFAAELRKEQSSIAWDDFFLGASAGTAVGAATVIIIILLSPRG